MAPDKLIGSEKREREEEMGDGADRIVKKNRYKRETCSTLILLITMTVVTINFHSWDYRYTDTFYRNGSHPSNCFHNLFYISITITSVSSSVTVANTAFIAKINL